MTKCHASSTWSSDSLEGGKNQTQMSQIWFYFWSWSNSRISASAKEKRRAHLSLVHSNFILVFIAVPFFLLQVLVYKCRLLYTPFLFTSNTCNLMLINMQLRKRELMSIWQDFWNIIAQAYTTWNNSRQCFCSARLTWK